MSSVIVLQNCAAFYGGPFLCLGRRLSRRLQSYSRRFTQSTPISRSIPRLRATEYDRIVLEMNKDPGEELSTEFFANVMPKEEIGATRFLKDHPDYDGRDVLIAILDTGVDPGTKGLQLTTDGRPKIVDMIDCTGDGDVDTSEIVKADDDGCIKGIHGKLMKLNSSWTNPSGDWHIGIRPAYQLVPSGLENIMKQKRLKKFQANQREALTAANQALADFNKDHPKCTNEEDQKTKGELESRVQLLHSMMANYKDPGPMIHCVVWNDGVQRRAALDTTDFYDEEEGKGKLEDFIPMTNFHLEHQYGTFSESEACNYALNIYEDGNVLSIVVDCGSHGTHVAGIATAYHPESPEYNGIAPGARIVVCKIGDLRFSTLETAMALVRGVVAAIHWKVDLVNLSFGECSAHPNHGRVLEVINDMVYKHGIIFVTAAGNLGPALSTISAPGCCDGGIAFGAYVSPAMAAAAHSVRKKIQDGRQYAFSSRGPTVNGRLGVEFSSSGGAISNMPQWSGTARKLANGTSMASPNGCGGVALLLSGLKQTGGAVSRNRIVRAMESTAVPPDIVEYDCPSELVYGRGLFQVDKAWDYLEKSGDVDALDIRFNVEVVRTDDQDNAMHSFMKPRRLAHEQRMSGIYIREPEDIGKKHAYSCSVNSILPEDADVVTEKLDIDLKLALESTSNWVTCPDALLLSNGSRSFEIEVDGSSLDQSVNYAEIRGIDTTAPWRGPLFRVPITVLRPEHHTNKLDIDFGTLNFKEGKEVRKFVPVPWDANWAELTITAGDFEGSRLYVGDAVLLIPDTRTDNYCTDISMNVTRGESRTAVFAVAGGRMLEFCLAQDWTSLGDSNLSAKLEFHSVSVAQGNQLTLDGSAGNLKIQAMAPLRSEKIKPSVSLKNVDIPLTPTESSLIPLNTSRDTLPDARVIHKLTLTYKLKLQEGGKITPRLPLFNKQMYDCEVEGQMVHIFDSNKKLLVVSEVYPSSVTVKKGDYTIIAVLRHDNTQILKQYERVPLIIEKTLEKPITVPVYKTHLDSVKGGDKIKSYALYPGQYSTMVIGPLMEALPKDCLPGYAMNGTLQLGRCRQTSNWAPTRISMKYIVPPSKSTNNNNDINVEELPTPAKLSNAARDAKIKVLEGLTLNKGEQLQEFDEALVQLKTDYPGHLPILTTVLKKYDALDEEKRTKKEKDILQLCEEIVSCIDKIELAVFLARKSPDETKEGKKRSKEATEEKEALIMALDKQLMTILRQQQSNASVDYEVLRPIFEELKKWADPKESNLALMHARLEAASGRQAEAIKLLDELINSDKAPPTAEVFEFKIECAAALGWHHWARYEKSHLAINFPKALVLT